MPVPETFEQFIDRVADDPGLYLYTVDVIPDKANFLPVEASTYRDSMFLDNRIAVKNPQWIVTPLKNTIAQINPGLELSSCKFIFHVGHCGSTMFTRLLEQFDDVLALREPLSLRGLAAVKRDLGSSSSYVDPENYEDLRRFVYGMISRRFSPTQTVIAKCTSDVCNIADELLGMHHANRALLMYLPLQSFLTVMLRNATRREETAYFTASRLGDLRARGIRELPPVYALSDAQRAALSWISNMAWFDALPGDHTRMINFEEFLSNPDNVLETACQFLGLPQELEKVTAVVNGPVLSAYSKDPNSPYNVASRRAELSEAARQFAPEIREGMQWAEQLCDDDEKLSGLKAYFIDSE